MKVTLTLSGSLTHSDDWLQLGGSIGCHHPRPPIFDSSPYFLYFVHCLINVLTSFLLVSVHHSVPCLSMFHFPPPRSSHRPSWLPPRRSAVSVELDPSERLLAPVMVVCSTLSHLTGHLHSSIYCLMPNLHVKSVFMNRFDRNNPAKTVMKRKSPQM